MRKRSRWFVLPAVTPLLASFATAVTVFGGPTAPAAAQVPPADEATIVARADTAIREFPQAVAATPDDRFTMWKVLTDPDGSSSVRYTRTRRGLPVRGGDIVVHLTSEGRLASANRAQAQPIAVDTQPQIDAGVAAAVARGRIAGVLERSGAPTLVIDATGVSPKLAWETEVHGLRADGIPSELQVRVDAITGALLGEDDGVKEATVNGLSVHSGTVPVNVIPMMGSGFFLSNPNGGTTCDLHNGTNTLPTATCDTFVGFGPSIGDHTMGNRASAGVDAQYGASTMFNYYNSTFGRAGIFDNGNHARSRVHWANNYANARWSDACQCMTYADGLGNQNPTISLDVVGHEATHGVTEHSVPGGLNYLNESGGLNEATSDIFGTMIEFYANNPNDAPDYLIGEKVDILGTGAPLRYMYNPPLDGHSYGCWTPTLFSDNVHYTSGVANHFFFLLANGSGATQFGTSPVCSGPALSAIGKTQAAAIWYRALTRYFTSTTGYVQAANPTNTARAATLSAAADLYGYCGIEYQAVRAAWTAVNVAGPDAGCAETRSTGWVHANQPSTASYSPVVQANSAGGTNTVTRLEAGRYRIAMTKLGDGPKGGTVHVTMRDGQVGMCKARDWFGFGDLTVLVDCYDVMGNRADRGFIASFTRSQLPGGTFGYLWAGQPTSSLYAANSFYSYNSKGLINRVARLGVGHYLATFPGLGVSGGTALVTAQGDGSARCHIDTWERDVFATADQQVRVWCTDRLGVPVDTTFDLSFTDRQSIMGTSRPSGYAWIEAPAPQPTPGYSFNTAGEANSVSHTVGTGVYQVTFNGVGSVTGVPHAVTQSYTATSVQCHVLDFVAVTPVGAKATVKCQTASGVNAEAFFNVMFIN